MKSFNRFYNMKMAVIDLTAGSGEIFPLSGDLLHEGIGGIGVNLKLFEQYHKEDPLVLGVGPLTGSFAPASALMAATFFSRKTNNLCHTPVLLRGGPELKFSGLDFLVIKGTSSLLQALLIGHGTVQLIPADALYEKVVPDALVSLRRQDVLNHRFIILTGPASDHHSPYAAVSTEMGSGLDKGRMAGWMGSRNLKAIILNGTRGLPFEKAHVPLTQKLRADLLAQPQFTKNGCLAVLKKMESSLVEKSFLAKAMSKPLACYNCVFPCMSYIQTPTLDGRKKRQTNGFVLQDHTGFLALLKKCGTQAFTLMNECFRLGIDPAAVAPLLPTSNNVEDAITILSKLAGTNDVVIQSSERLETVNFLPANITIEEHSLFGGGIPAIVPDEGGCNSGLWARRVVVAMVLGICPLIMVFYPQIEEGRWLRFVAVRDIDLECLKKHFDSTVKTLLKSSCIKS